MKQFIYIAISILGIGALLSGCAGSGNKSSISVTVEKNSEFPFVGCWSAADGSMLYIDDEIEEGSNAGVYRGHLYCEYTGKQGYYDECLIFHGDEESWEIATADEFDYTLDDFEYNGGNEDVIRDGFDNRVEDITYHRDPSIADKIGQKIRETIKQQEKAQKEEKIKIPREYKWIYGEWSSWMKSFTIKKPNLIYLDNHDGWLEFGIDGDKLHAYLAQDWIEFTLKTANKTIVDEGENIIYVKKGRTPKGYKRAKLSEDPNLPIIGCWKENEGRDIVYFDNEIVFDNTDEKYAYFKGNAYYFPSINDEGVYNECTYCQNKLGEIYFYMNTSSYGRETAFKYDRKTNTLHRQDASAYSLPVYSRDPATADLIEQKINFIKSIPTTISSNYSKVLFYEDGLYAVKNHDGLYGFVDGDNNVVIPCKLSSPPIKLPEEGAYWKDDMCFLGESKPEMIINKKGNYVYPADAEFLGLYNDSAVLRRRDGKMGVMGIHSGDIKLEWGNYSEIYFLRDRSGVGAYAFKKPGDDFFYTYSKYLDRANGKKYSSLIGVRDDGYDVYQPFSPAWPDEVSWLTTFESNGKWGVNSSDGEWLPAISTKPIQFYSDGNNYYAVVNDGKTNGGRDYVIDDNKEQFFPLRVEFLSRPDQYKLANVLYYPAYSFGANTKGEAKKGILNCITGEMIKILSENEEISSFSNGRATVTYRHPDGSKYNFSYTIDTNGKEYHDEEKETAILKAWQEDHPISSDSGISLEDYIKDQYFRELMRGYGF